LKDTNTQHKAIYPVIVSDSQWPILYKYV